MITRSSISLQARRWPNPLAMRRALFLCCVLLAVVLPGRGEVLKLATWRLRHEKEPGAQLAEAVPALKAAKPDAILVQDVQDWQVCAQITKALQPEDYSIGVCSSFRDSASGRISGRQVAILCKTKPLFYWSEPWKSGPPNSGGFGFVTIQKGKVRLALFSVLLSGTAGNTASSGQAGTQLCGQIETIRGWVTNSVQTFVVATAAKREPSTSRPGDFLAALAETGFVDAAAYLNASPRAPLAEGSHVLCDGQAFVLKMQPHPSTARNPDVATCDIELDPARIAQLREARWRPAAQSTAASTSPVQPASHRLLAAGVLFVVAGLLVGGGLVLLFSRKQTRRRTRGPVLLPPAGEVEGQAPLSYTVVVTPRSTTGSATKSPSHRRPEQPIVQIETDPLAQTHSTVWRERALAAEARAEHATRLLQSGLVPKINKWLKQKLLRRLLSDRTSLLRTQETTAATAQNVTERLTRVEEQVRHQNEGYHRRILELSQELLAAKAENRELIQARINQLRTEMQEARSKALRQAQLADPEVGE